MPANFFYNFWHGVLSIGTSWQCTFYPIMYMSAGTSSLLFQAHWQMDTARRCFQTVTRCRWLRGESCR